MAPCIDGNREPLGLPAQGSSRPSPWAWGKGEGLILVVPSLDLVAARAGAAWQSSNWMARYGTVAPFLQKLAASVD